MKVVREAGDRLQVFAGHEGGMQGPYAGADTYYTINRRTWLPVTYEYRQYRTDEKPRKESVAETLRAEYDVPLPVSVTTLRLPPEVRLIDTLTAPTEPNIPTESVQRASGLTSQAEALAMDADGNIFVRVRTWLGNMKLGAEGTSTWHSVSTPIRYRTFGETQDTAFHTDDGRRYLEFRLPRQTLDMTSTGDTFLLLAPLEPRPEGALLPRLLTLNLMIVPQAMTKGGSSILFRQEFAWTLPLPEKVAPIDVERYLPPDHHQRFRFAPGADDSTVEAKIAEARAGQYHLQNDWERAIFWQKQALAALPPFTSTAQFCRLHLAGIFSAAGDTKRAAEMYREVIRISREYPKTWSYYAWQARASLKSLTARKPQRAPRAPGQGGSGTAAASRGAEKS
jgi:hypothetical protein